MIDGVREHTLYVANDNDFDLTSSNPNQFFVFAVSDDDLANAQASDQTTLGSVKTRFVAAMPRTDGSRRRGLEHRTADERIDCRKGFRSGECQLRGRPFLRSWGMAT